jgi:hypothetical protein
MRAAIIRQRRARGAWRKSARERGRKRHENETTHVAQSPGAARRPSPNREAAVTPADTARSGDRDVSTIDGLVAALYESISGPAGPRDWERDRKLFAPGAVLMPTGPIPAVPSSEGSGADSTARTLRDDATGRRPLQRAPMSFDGWLASRSSFFAADDFYEWEVARQNFRFGNVAHVLSAYHAGRRLRDSEILFRGINSLQLFDDSRRWWIVSIAWDNERPDNPLPEWARAG